MRNLVIISSIVVISAIIVSILFQIKYIKGLDDLHTSSRKQIWTYWSPSDHASDNIFVDRCIESWKQWNPEYKVHILSKDNYRDYIDDDISAIRHSHDSEARFSDYLRLLVLAKYGGIWIDASIICQQSLNPVFDFLEDQYECVGFSAPFHSQVLESWFIACNPGSPFIQKWCKEFLRTGEFETMGEYLEDLNEKGVDTSIVPMTEYLAIHCAALPFLSMSDVLLVPSENGGPFTPHGDTKWDSKETVKNICKGGYRDIPLIKFRGVERNMVRSMRSMECLFS